MRQHRPQNHDGVIDAKHAARLGETSDGGPEPFSGLYGHLESCIHRIHSSRAYECALSPTTDHGGTVEPTDADFFFDPVCPWAWITSRWAVEVAQLRSFEIQWRFISLWRLNASKDYDTEFPPGYVGIHTLGLRLLRVAAIARSEGGNEAVGALYGTLGRLIHDEHRRGELIASLDLPAYLADKGIPIRWTSATEDESLDTVIEEETELALQRAGRDVGTPVITFEAPHGPSFFGPILSRIPRGQEAVDLWNATEMIARFPGFAELKRSLREPPQFT